MNKILTVVVPIYKVEQYIDKCLNSLIVSDSLMDSLEVIAVNDGTPDRSAIIAKKFEVKYSGTFRVIDKENGGHGSAWNRGLKEAKGKYISFLDSDDWYTNNNFQTILEKLIYMDVDLVFTNMNIYHQETGKNESVIIPNLNENIEYQAESFNWFSINSSMELTNFHHCIYKTELLKPLLPLFLEKQYYDDGILFVAPIILTKTFAYINLHLYNYLIGREGQTMTKENMLKHYDDYGKLIKSQIALINKYPHLSISKQQRIDRTISLSVSRHYDRLSKLPYYVAKNELKKWNRFVLDNIPSYKQCKKAKLYNILPFPIFKLLILCFTNPIFSFSKE